MRINKLKLDQFGHFLNREFDFGKPPSSEETDFHVIYGPNEAGKTTLKEGYLRLLYGFRRIEPYGFLHQRKNLRVSGELFDDGKLIEIARLPTGDPSLRDGNDNPIPEQTVQNLLGAISDSDYRNLFCLDDDTIEKGGEEIINAKGDIGRLLFSTKSGISDLSVILEDVRENADRIHRKRASTSMLAVLKNSQAEVEQKIKEMDVSSVEFHRLKVELKQNREREEEAKKRRTELYEGKSALDAKIKSIPLIESIRELQAGLEDKSDWPQRMDINLGDLDRMMVDRSNHVRDVEKLKEQISELESKLEHLDADQEHLDLKEKLEELDELRSRYNTAELDLEKRFEECKVVQDEMTSAVKGILKDSSIDLKSIEVNKQQLSKLDKLREKLTDSGNRISDEMDSIKDAEAKLEAERVDFKRVNDDVLEGTELPDLLKRFRVDSLSTQYAKSRVAVDSAREKARKSLDALKVKGQEFSKVPSCPLTLEEAEEKSKLLDELSRNLESLEKDKASLDLEIANLSGKCDRIRSDDGLVSDQEAEQLKELRDELWTEHKKELTVKTANQFEKSMHDLDVAESGRLSNASDLGELRQLEQQIIECENRKKQVEAEAKGLGKRIREINLELLKAVTGTGLKSPLSAAAFVAWLRKLEVAAESESELRNQFETHGKTFEKAEKLCDELKKHVKLEDPEFADLLEEAKSLVERQQEHVKELKQAKGLLDGLERELKSRKDKLVKLKSGRVQLQADWKSLISEALPKNVDAESLAESLQPLRELLELRGRHDDLTHRIKEMEKDKSVFAARIGTLASLVEIEIGDDPLKSFDELKKMSDKAHKIQSQHADFKEQLDKCRSELETAEKELNGIEVKMREYARLFPESVTTGTIEELKDAISIAEEVIRNRIRLDELQKELLQALNVDTVDAAETELAGENLTDLQARLQETIADLKTVEQEYESAIEQRSFSERDFQSIGGDVEVAKLVEKKSTLELERRELTLEYLKLNFGHMLAEEAIRRFRDKHRSEMMVNTEQAFRKLTNNAYTGLKVIHEGNSEVLLAIHSSESAKRAVEMSKGTRFQLYLALRAAAHQQLSEHGDCLPFFCDDIFETFDEERTRAACGIMEQIGSRGQAIYLTHHRHVVDIAKEVCGNVVQVHEF